MNNNEDTGYKCYPNQNDTMISHNSGIRGRAKLFESIVDSTALRCTSCDDVVICEYNKSTRRIGVFEYDPYTAKVQQKIRHAHPAGPLMRRHIESRITIEDRLFHHFDEGDFHVLTQSRKKRDLW